MFSQISKCQERKFSYSYTYFVTNRKIRPSTFGIPLPLVYQTKKSLTAILTHHKNIQTSISISLSFRFLHNGGLPLKKFAFHRPCSMVINVSVSPMPNINIGPPGFTQNMQCSFEALPNKWTFLFHISFSWRCHPLKRDERENWVAPLHNTCMYRDMILL